jgi:hypothetical protein
MKVLARLKKPAVFIPTLIVALVVAILILSHFLAPETSTVVILTPDNADPEAIASADCLKQAGGEGCLRLPQFDGQSLAGDSVTFPAVFSSECVLLVVPFSREQQMSLVSQLPTLDQLAGAYPACAFYDVPVITDIPAPVRMASMTGMKLLLDEGLHDNIVIAFVDNRELFLDAMAIPDIAAIQTFILNKAGEVLWRRDGVIDETAITEIAAELALLTGASIE